MHRGVLVIMCASVSGCGGCGGGGGSADTEWISEGSGEANVAPLMPLRPGTRSGPLDRWVMDAAVQVGGRRALRISFDLAQAVGGRASAALLVAQGGDGVELLGDEGNLLATPRLWVPDTVRDGMRWRSHVAGAPTLEYAVEGPEAEDSVFGPVVAWTIRVLDEAGRQVEQWKFHEDLGLTLSEATGIRGVVLDATIDGAPLQPELPVTPLVPLAITGTTGFGDNLALLSVGYVATGDAAGGKLIVKGVRACPSDDGFCIEEACFDLGAAGAAINGPPPQVEGYNLGTGCVRHWMDGVNQLRLTSDASGAIVLPSGVHWVPRGPDGSLTNGDTLFPTAVYADPDTQEFRLLYFSQNGVDVVTRAPWQAYDQEAVNFAATGDPPLVQQWVSPALDDYDDFFDQDFARSATLSAPGEPPQLALITSDGVLTHSTLDGDLLTAPELVSAIAGQLAVSSTAAGHALLAVSAGGHIDELVRDPDGTLAREAIGHVDPPAGEFVIAALDVGEDLPGKLLVVTHDPPPPDLPDLERSFGTVRFYITDRREPVRWAWPAGSAVTSTQRNWNAIVCYPPTDEPLDTTGWLIGGRPALDVIEAVPGRCTLIVRDVLGEPALAGVNLVGMSIADVNPLDAQIRHDVEGPVPGVGRMRIQSLRSTSPLTDVDHLGDTLTPAPLAAGGWATSRRLFTPGGMQAGVPANAWNGGFGQTGVPDATGTGVWVHTDRVLLIGPDPQSLDALGAELGATSFAAAGGGLVLNNAGTTWTLYEPDGTVTPLPAATTVTYQAMLRTGELCGRSNTLADTVQCVDASGAVTETATIVQGSIVTVLPDDSMLVGAQNASTSASEIWRWAPGAAPALWADGYVVTASRSLDGEVWVVTSTGAVGRATPAGVDPLDISWVTKTSWYGANIATQPVAVHVGDREAFVVMYGCAPCGNRAFRMPLSP